LSRAAREAPQNERRKKVKEEAKREEKIRKKFF
jgi:hypothetical protein